MKYLLPFLLLFLFHPAFAAINIDNSSNGVSGVATSPAYYTLVVSSSATAICVANQGAVSSTDSTTNVQIGLVTGTSTATKMGGVQNPTDRFIDLWCLTNPPVGTVTIGVTFTGTFLSSEAASYTGVGSIDAAVTNTSASASTFAITTTPTVDSAWILAAAGNSNRGPTAGAGTTVRQTQSNGLALGDNNAAITPPAATSLNFAVTLAGTWGGVIVALEPIVPVVVTPGVNFAIQGVKMIVQGVQMVIY